MFRLNRAISACILASALLPTVAAQAATYYVATTGNNSSSGTSSQPWRTVAYAAAKMVAGDTTYVKGGVYSEGLVRFNKSGTSSAPIKLLNAPGAFPVISCKPPANGVYPMVLLSAGTGRVALGWITIEGFEVRNCHDGIKFKNLHNSTIRRNWIHHNRANGIFGNGTKIVIDRNKINDNAGSHGIYTNGSYYTVTNNLIYANAKYGIQLNGSSTSTYNSSLQPGPEYANSYNWTISNNTIAYGRAASGMVVWGSTCNNARIENNIFYENGVSSTSAGAQGINFISTTCKEIVIRNNLAYASGSGATKFLGTGATKGVHYTESGNISNTLKPNFVNAPATLPSSPNFALTSGSPAIDNGLSLSSTKISYAGTTRPKLSAYDMGAYEYAGSSTALAAPTSLQVMN
ncbi:MAG: right-handed parallel beta-helix repeat-containing protein [Nitrospira sp.]|nr:right-handed parallel beta-helix repeat-containing protein [Nitrospira sp.]